MLHFSGCFNRLSHHGVKGQEWGVRRGPPYPLGQNSNKNGKKKNPDKDVRVSKGTKVKHISDSPNIDLRSEPLHISYEEWDNLVYKGAYAAGKMLYGGSKKIFEHTYKAAEELVSPSKKKRVDNFMELVKENKAQAIKDLEAIERDNQVAGISRKRSSKSFSEMSDKELREEGYETFVSGLEDRDLYRTAQQYVDRIKEKSYNALVDDNNARVYNDAKSPMIVLDAKKSLVEEGRGRRVSRNEMNDALREVKKHMSKKGKDVYY